MVFNNKPLTPKLIPKHFPNLLYTREGLLPNDYTIGIQSVSSLCSDLINDVLIFLNKISIQTVHEPKFKLLSSYSGHISEMVFIYPTIQLERKKGRRFPFLEFLESVIEELPSPSRTFYIIVQHTEPILEALEERLKAAALKRNHMVHIVRVDPLKHKLNMWVKDHFLVTSTTEKEGVSNQQYWGDEHVKKILAGINAIPNSREKTTIREYVRPDFYIEGGNVLCGDDFILIGVNGSKSIEKLRKGLKEQPIILIEAPSTTLYQNWIKGKQTPDGFLNYYEVDEYNQPLFHIDLFITLAKDKEGRTVLVVGQPIVGFDLDKTHCEEIKQLVSDLILETCNAIDAAVLHIEKQLSNKSIDYRITRNPLPLTYYEDRSGGKKKRYWCWPSYNNCLVEHYTEKDHTGKSKFVKRVILPSYGINSNYSELLPMDPSGVPYGAWTELHRFDLQNKWIWEKKLGYEVILLTQDFNPFVCAHGSLSCLINSINRNTLHTL